MQQLLPPPAAGRCAVKGAKTATADCGTAWLQGEDWPAILGGTASPGNRWRLVFTTGTKDVQAALKGSKDGERQAGSRWGGWGPGGLSKVNALFVERHPPSALRQWDL